MNTKDLMIGNWICIRKHEEIPMQISSINAKEVVTECETLGSTLYPSVEDIRPIEVTDEMLVKTGFDKIDRTDDSEYYGVDDSRGPIFERWIGTDDYFITISENTNRLGGRRWCSIDNYKKEYVGAFHFTYVHELQNGIRLITKQDLDVKL